MKVLNKDEFIELVNTLMRHHGIDVSDESHPMWEVEHGNPEKCQFFCSVKGNKETINKEYWDWIEQTMTGSVIRFLYDDVNHSDLWGFSNQEDVTMWLLKWNQ